MTRDRDEERRKQRQRAGAEDHPRAGFEQPDRFMSYDWTLKQNPLQDLPADGDDVTRPGDHFEVEWKGPELPETAGRERPKEKSEQGSRRSRD